MMIMLDSAAQDSARRLVDEIDHARAQEYALLATLLSHSPDSRLLSRLAGLPGDVSPIGLAHAALGEAARRANAEDVAQEYFALFAGLGQSQLLPYSSHYLNGSLYGRPLARLRETLQNLGIEKMPERSEPAPPPPAPIVISSSSICYRGSSASSSISKVPNRPAFTDLLACLGEFSSRSKRKPLPFRLEHGLLSAGAKPSVPERARKAQRCGETRCVPSSPPVL